MAAQRFEDETSGQSEEPSASNLSTWLMQEHDRLDSLIADVQLMVADSEMERADSTFHELSDGLARHLRQEEESLFPLIEQRTADTGTTDAMRREHQRIVVAMEEAAAALDRQNAGEVREAMASLDLLLRRHHAAEERVVYPRLDELLARGERAEITEQLGRERARHAERARSTPHGRRRGR